MTNTRTTNRGSPSRRALLGATAATALAGALPVIARSAPPILPRSLKPLPLAKVRLLPSPFCDALEANLRYVLSLDADRLLHNFRLHAGLPPKGAVYGGWESETIAGHTLGHLLSALALLHAQADSEEARTRAAYIVDELAACQAQAGDGYVAGFTRRRKDGTIEDGKAIWPEIRAGDIRAADFDLNGAWSPLYNLHKLFAGLLDADEYCADPKALGVARGLAGYLSAVFAALDEDQLQRVLACEHGGITESLATLSARTSDPHWLRLAERLYHRKVLDPLVEGRDELAGLHANTQIPKLIGQARIAEAGGEPGRARAARYFWEVVTQHHSYVIGGNSDRERFNAPDAIAGYITEQTCEHCNSYNMLKLTRQVFAAAPHARAFDYYERTHFNHVLAAHNPQTGMFTYMTPLMSGAAREFSTPANDFWCCVGTGMESHAKHGDSIYWEGGDTLLVNLFIPSRAEWAGARFVLETAYPFEGTVRLRLDALARPRTFAIGLRIPAWAKDATLTVNGEAVTAAREAGYAIVRRRWKAGDLLTVTLPMALRLESTQDDSKTVAVLRGPLVLAADLGPSSAPYDETLAPALVGTDILSTFRAGARPATYDVAGASRPEGFEIGPFFKAYDRRSAVYFRHFTDLEWDAEKRARAQDAVLRAALDARSVDVMRLGDSAAEKDHALASSISYALVYRMRKGRDARTGGFFEFRLKTAPGPLMLQATYWGEERNRIFDILVDGVTIATQSLDAPKPQSFVDIDYAVPERLTREKECVVVRFQPHEGRTAGPVFSVRIVTRES